MKKRWPLWPTAGGHSRWWDWVVILASGFLPGALAGTQVAGLLFFLNPHLPFTTGPVLRGIVLYAIVLGTVSLALHLPFTWGQRRRALRFFPWALSIVFALAALMDWFHASYFAFYLPSGINKRLIKAAVWLSLAAIVCFYTALLHTLHRRPYRFRSRVLLLAVAVLSIYVTVERREAFRPSPEPTPRPSTVESSQRPQLLVVGLEAATLDAILPLAEQGRLPFFATLIQQGAHGHLATLTPTRRSTLWTTLATGKYPYKHGVLADTSHPASFLVAGFDLILLPLGMAFERWGTFGGDGRMTDGELKKVLSLWEVFSRLDIPTTVIGWPAIDPVPRGLVAAYSDPFFRGYSGRPHVRPAAAGRRARTLRVDPENVDPSLLSKFGPEAPADVRLILTQDLWRESVALSLLDQQPEVEAIFVVLPGLGSISKRTFGGYSAVQFDGVQGPSYQTAAQLLTAYYIHLDELVGRLWQRLGTPRLLAVVSAYGTKAPDGWRKVWGAASRRRPLEGDFEGGPDGVLLLLGEGLRAGVFLSEAGLADLAPTLLYGLGLPVARDFDGQILTEAFEPSFLVRHPLTFVPSYETLTTSSPAPLRDLGGE